MLRHAWVGIIAALLAACGGGGGSGAGGDPDPGPGGPPPRTNPDVALVFVSGHQGIFDSDPSLSYLDQTIGPRLTGDLRSFGYTVEVAYFVDHPTATNAGGYADLTASLRFARDTWVIGQAIPTDVIVVSHSHGGVWASAAVREVSNLPIRLHVALDHSSYGWGIVGHNLHDEAIGGDPRDAYYIETLVSCPTDTGGWNEATYYYDIEDVVFGNVIRAFEVRSGASPLGGEPYDERWNARVDGSLTGLRCFFSATDHSEVHSPNGSTYPAVFAEVLDALP